MSNFILKQNGFTSYTALPNCFIEHFMVKAAGEFVKIYIYLLKCVSENRQELSISRIADTFNDTEKDVVRALKYWAKQGLIALTFDDEGAVSSLCMRPFSAPSEGQLPADDASAESHTLNVTDAPVPGTPAPKRVKNAIQPHLEEFSDDGDVKLMLHAVATYMGRPLSSQETDIILFIHKELGFSFDLVDYLVEYCVSMGSKGKNINYIKSVALAWSEKGIKTVEAAKLMEHIYSENCRPVLKAFGITGREPARDEEKYISTWTLSYGFSLEIILNAVDRTMMKAKNPSFEYTDKILKDWYTKGVKSMADIKALDEQFDENKKKQGSTKPSGSAKPSPKKTTFSNFKQRSYDMQELEQALVNK